MQKRSLLRMNPDATFQCMSNHTCCNMVVLMRLWLTVSHFQSLAGDIMAFYSCRSNLFSGMEFNVDSIIKNPFSNRNYNETLEIVPW